MDKKLNPLDGEIDLLGDTVSDIIRKLNPLTGRLELVYKADSYIQKINPFIGDFDIVGGTGASYIIKEVTGNGYINLTNAAANHLMELKAYGGTEQATDTYLDTATALGKCVQASDPTPSVPVDIVCNNGTISYDSINNTITVTGTTETVTDSRGFTATCQYLLGIGDDTDTQEIISGTVTRNIGYKIFKGTESFGSSSAYGTALYISAGSATWGADRTKAVLCTHFLGKSTATSQQPLYSCFFNSSGHFYFRTEETATDFKAWLAELYENDTPLILFFVKSTETTESVTGQTLTKEPLTATGALPNLVVNTTSSTHTIPAPYYPLDIKCNNGVIKARHQSGLPLGYKMVEYIKATSDIPLNFYTNQNSEIEAKWYKNGSGSQYIYQANSGSSLTNNTTAYASYGSGNWRFGNKVVSIDPMNTNIISIQNKDGVWFNNEKKGTYTNVNNFTGDIEFKALGTITGYNPTINLSYIKHSQNGVLLGHYVSCIAPDNSIGLYDLISGVFYTNADATITAGDQVSDPIEIYVDGTTETVDVFGKNLFDKNSYTEINAYVNSNTGTLTQTTSGYCAVIPCLPNTTYTISGRSTSAWGAFTSSDIGTTATSYSKKENVSITTGENDKYLIGMVRANQDDIDYRNTLQIEFGSTATTYEPYYNGGTATAEMLLGIGDYKDVQEVISGNVTRKMGIKILDGSENWASAGSGDANAYLVAIRKTEIAPDIDTSADYTNYMCSHVKMGNNDGANTLSITSATFGFRLGLNTDIITDVSTKKETVKAWLKQQYDNGTPVIVVYPLATASTETVAGQTMNIQAGNNTIGITQASIDNLGLYAKYKATA